MVGLSAAVFASSCRQSSQTGTLLARVGDRVLTLEEARSEIDTSQQPFNRNLQSYVASWVDNELLYQEATGSGVERTQPFQHDLSEAKRQLLIHHFLQRELHSDKSVVTEEEMLTYFQQHSAEFFVREDMVRLDLIAFSTREQATTFAAAVSRGSPWEEVLSTVLADTTKAPSIVVSSVNKYYSQRTLFPPELWKIATTLNINEISFPLKTSAGYFVVQPLALVHQGKSADFDLAREEVRDRLQIEKGRQQYENLLGTLRKRYNVEVVLPMGTQRDTVQSHE